MIDEYGQILIDGDSLNALFDENLNPIPFRSLPYTLGDGIKSRFFLLKNGINSKRIMLNCHLINN